MKKASVSLLVISPSMSLDELSSKLGRVPSSGSHSKGDARPRGGPWSETIWRFDSDAQETMTGAEIVELTFTVSKNSAMSRERQVSCFGTEAES